MVQEEYLNRVYGGWLGKCLGGAAGAPVEGIKKLIPCEDFRKMMRPDLPNDDLDLQLLWLEVLQKKGESVTAKDLADAWNEQCWYPFNEYGIFLKNYDRGIWPPYSGSFNNPLFCEGEGCPIRSEIWGMLFPGNPEKAAYYAEMDGSLDHAGEAVWIEQFYAAMEAQAFDETNIENLIKGQLHYLPKQSRSRRCAELVMECYESGIEDWNSARTKMLQKFGHFDFTNAVTNLGIVLIAMLYGGKEIYQVINIAFRSGYDTDCTCATAAAIWGIQNGAEQIPNELKDLVQDQFVVGIELDRTNTSIKKLSEETCELGYKLKQTSEASSYEISPYKETLGIEIEYHDKPAIGFLDKCSISICVKNQKDQERSVKVAVDHLPTGWEIVPENEEMVIPSLGETRVNFTIYTTETVQVLENANLLHASVKAENREVNKIFGIAGAAEWTAAGPYFENLEKNDPPGLPSPHGQDCNLPTLECMVNNAVYLDKEYIDESQFEESLLREETCQIHGYEDLLSLDDIFTFYGQGCIYLKQTIISPIEQDVWAVIGNNDGMKLWVNEELKFEKDEIRLWTPYNNYQIIHLNQGENQVVLKILKRTENIRFSFALRKYEGEHFHRKRWCVDLACKKSNQ